MTAAEAQMKKDEFRETRGIVLEQEIFESPGDPDEGLKVRKAVRDRLLRQREEVALGERGEPFEEVAASLTCSEEI